MEGRLLLSVAFDNGGELADLSFIPAPHSWWHPILSTNQNAHSVLLAGPGSFHRIGPLLPSVACVICSTGHSVHSKSNRSGGPIRDKQDPRVWFTWERELNKSTSTSCDHVVVAVDRWLHAFEVFPYLFKKNKDLFAGKCLINVINTLISNLSVLAGLRKMYCLDFPAVVRHRLFRELKKDLYKSDYYIYKHIFCVEILPLLGLVQLRSDRTWCESVGETHSKWSGCLRHI